MNSSDSLIEDLFRAALKETASVATEFYGKSLIRLISDAVSDPLVSVLVAVAREFVAAAFKKVSTIEEKIDLLTMASLRTGAFQLQTCLEQRITEKTKEQEESWIAKLRVASDNLERAYFEVNPEKRQLVQALQMVALAILPGGEILNLSKYISEFREHARRMQDRAEKLKEIADEMGEFVFRAPHVGHLSFEMQIQDQFAAADFYRRKNDLLEMSQKLREGAQFKDLFLQFVEKLPSTHGAFLSGKRQPPKNKK